MAYPDPRNSGIPPATRRSPLSINTSHAGALPQRAGGNRFSYIETPVEMQEPQFGVQQRYTPGASPIRESPVSATPRQTQQQPTYTQQAMPSQQQQQQETTQPILTSQRYTMPVQQQQQYTQQQQPFTTPTQPHQFPQRVETPSTHIPRTNSPYDIPEPQQTHPAYFAPVADPTTASVPRSRPGSIPPQSPTPEQLHKPQRASTMPIRSESDEYVKQPLSPQLQQHYVQPQTTIKPDPTYVPYANTASAPPNRTTILKSPTQPIFSPTSLAGPNGVAPDLHQPGQVAHPNMTLSSASDKGEWQHSLCECGGDVGTCLTGIFCPCILDSKTAYRLERKGAKKDPSDLLGFSSCNGRCGVMTLFGMCGIFCLFPLTLRTRIRHTYHLTGSIGDDILHACCCCCCVAIQNEREVRGREDKLRQNAGPAQTQTQYRAGVSEGMVYSPGGR